MFLFDYVNSECVGGAVVFATYCANTIASVGWDLVNHFGQGLPGRCFEHGGTICQQLLYEVVAVD